MPADLIRIRRIDAWSFRAPTPEPVATSFGTMRDRPAVFLRLEDADGAFGWGEVFANWPVAGAEHRVNLLADDIADLVLAWEGAEPADLFDHLTQRTHIRALQCGEWGPFRQVVAGLDIAMTDLAARRVGVSVASHLGAAREAVPAYASGIPVAKGAHTVADLPQHRAFKVKIGFDRSGDLSGLHETSAALPDGAQLFMDANQAWDVGKAEAILAEAAPFSPGWIEEPIPADAPMADWRRLAEGPVPLAAGENIAGETDFAATLASGHLAFVQPDIMKWGGFTGLKRVAAMARESDTTLCPHYLGGGIGLTASAHLLAAIGGDGLLEVDVNPNPLRDAFETACSRVEAGLFHLASGTGLGIEELPRTIATMRTHHRSRQT